jgi:hypothetical protein
MSKFLSCHRYRRTAQEPTEKAPPQMGPIPISIRPDDSLNTILLALLKVMLDPKVDPSQMGGGEILRLDAVEISDIIGLDYNSII